MIHSIIDISEHAVVSLYKAYRLSVAQFFARTEFVPIEQIDGLTMFFCIMSRIPESDIFHLG
jgi:hypothetical protein